MKLDMGSMMKQVQKMQADMAKMQAELESRILTEESGGGMVKATVNGKKELISLSIDESVLKDNDKEMIETIRSVTDVPLTADANQGWKDKHQALDMINWLNDKNVLYVEQPLPKEMIEENAWITQNSPLPILGDESIQRLGDLIKMKDVYTGVVVKLMKCTGMREANKMISLAHSFNMKVMLGCMTETSCAISAASQLSPMADWADLDGALLIKNDPFEGMKVIDGKVTLSDYPGIGLKS